MRIKHMSNRATERVRMGKPICYRKAELGHRVFAKGTCRFLFSFNTFR
jgi:hypothetical protein